MSVFRDPYYLDVEKLQPFASHNGIEADATIAVTVRDTDGKRTGGGVQVQVPGAVDVNFDHSRSGDNETVQNQTYSTHPVSALNALIDKLAGGGPTGESSRRSPRSQRGVCTSSVRVTGLSHQLQKWEAYCHPFSVHS